MQYLKGKNLALECNNSRSHKLLLFCVKQRIMCRILWILRPVFPQLVQVNVDLDVIIGTTGLTTTLVSCVVKKVL